uniref:Tyrosine-protein phosphatase domain-containing protein n=1 Tax=Accipiter nisus TaxID=211598 RepID=A0A8B9NPJ6_9AVES
MTAVNKDFQKLMYLLEMVELCFRSTAEIATFCFSTDDKTRVPLGEKNGYINASYITMKVGEEEHFYIITQGPLPSTMADFWQMVWESESDLIAMMTKEVELGQVQCHRYWPEPPHDAIDLANFHLRLDNYQIVEYFIIRIIEMINKQVS